MIVIRSDHLSNYFPYRFAYRITAFRPTGRGGALRKKPTNLKKIAFDDSDVSSDEEVEVTPAKMAKKKQQVDGGNSLISPIRYGMKKQKRRPWSNEEEACVRAGVERYGEGNWAKILSDYR